MVPIYVENRGVAERSYSIWSSFMLKTRAENSTTEKLVPLSSPLLRQSKMHMKEGNLVMADVIVAEDFFCNNGNDIPEYVVPVDDIR